jgi:PTH1 family peptidyl-tRNA hydrolase
MKMIVGLGNIGKEYHETRHNIGFMTVDAMADKYGATFKQDGAHSAFVADIRVDGEKVLLVKPTTYMNDSGRAVGPLMSYYDLDVADLLVVQDDMDMDLGRLRLRTKGSAGGHNGIKSIAAHLDTQTFNRLKFGIGHPAHVHKAVVDFVLGKFGKDEQPDVQLGIDKALDIFEAFASGKTMPDLMNQFN